MEHLLDANFDQFAKRFQAPVQRVLAMQGEVEQYGFAEKTFRDYELETIRKQGLV